MPRPCAAGPTRRRARTCACGSAVRATVPVWRSTEGAQRLTSPQYARWGARSSREFGRDSLHGRAASLPPPRPPAAGADAGARSLARRRLGRLRAAHRRGRRVPQAALARALARRAARAAEPRRARRRPSLLARRLDDPLPLAPLGEDAALAPAARGRRADRARGARRRRLAGRVVARRQARAAPPAERRATLRRRRRRGAARATDRGSD